MSGECLTNFVDCCANRLLAHCLPLGLFVSSNERQELRRRDFLRRVVMAYDERVTFTDQRKETMP